MTFLDQFGRDLLYFIAIAKGVVAGAPPYSTFGSYYPPLTTLLLAPLAFLPALPTYFAWTLANLAFLVHLGRGRRAVAWAAFTPVLFTVFMGNMDLAAVWLAQWLDRKDWKSIAAAVLITLKPQLRQGDGQGDQIPQGQRRRACPLQGSSQAPGAGEGRPGPHPFRAADGVRHPAQGLRPNQESLAPGRAEPE